MRLSAAVEAGCLVIYTGGRNNHTLRHANRLVRTALDGLPTGGLLAVLGAILALAVSLGPVAVALGLRISAGD